MEVGRFGDKERACATARKLLVDAHGAQVCTVSIHADDIAEGYCYSTAVPQGENRIDKKVTVEEDPIRCLTSPRHRQQTRSWYLHKVG